jgi:hypothetical protein
MATARRAVAELELPFDYLCVVALGSYGRLEAHADASDFEWLLIFDDARVSDQEATVAQAALTRLFARILGRERLSINKTFRQLCAFSDLGSSVGGLAETSQMLTYRVLTLTEGLPLSPGQGHDRVLHALASIYAGSHTAGHRLLSLATELARYYRTVRASYKYKVDEERKPWAVRALKNRSYRRFAFLSVALQFVVLGPRIDYSHAHLFDARDVVPFLRLLGRPPLERLLSSLATLGLESDAAKSAVVAYDQVHAALASPKTRKALDTIEPSERFGNPVYEPLRAACAHLHASLARLVLDLPEHPRQQLLEMFLL